MPNPSGASTAVTPVSASVDDTVQVAPGVTGGSVREQQLVKLVDSLKERLRVCGMGVAEIEGCNAWCSSLMCVVVGVCHLAV